MFSDNPSSPTDTISHFNPPLNLHTSYSTHGHLRATCCHSGCCFHSCQVSSLLCSAGRLSFLPKALTTSVSTSRLLKRSRRSILLCFLFMCSPSSLFLCAALVKINYGWSHSRPSFSLLKFARSSWNKSIEAARYSINIC